MRGFIVGLVAAVLVAAALVAGIVTPGSRASSEVTTTKVKVTASEFKYVLSRKAAPKGTIVFTFVNKGKLAHDFKIAGKKTAKVAPGKSATLRVTIAKKGKLNYLCTVPGHAAAGMKGVFAGG
jgi:plastocyanin